MLEVRITQEWLSNKKGVQEMGRLYILSLVLVGTAQIRASGGPRGAL